MLLYEADDLRIKRRRRFTAQDPDLIDVHTRWESALRKAVQELPEIRFEEER